MGHDKSLKYTAEREGEMDRWQEKCGVTVNEEEEEA